jgi:hypothetical protein
MVILPPDPAAGALVAAGAGAFVAAPASAAGGLVAALCEGAVAVFAPHAASNEALKPATLLRRNARRVRLRVEPSSFIEQLLRYTRSSAEAICIVPDGSFVIVAHSVGEDKVNFKPSAVSYQPSACHLPKVRH